VTLKPLRSGPNMKINLGCGNHRMEGFIGVDRVKMDAVDVVHDLNVFPYPFCDDSIDEVHLFNILEHLPDTIRVIEEVWRICKGGAIVRIGVPYYNSPGASADPTHLRFFTESTFDYFTEDGATWLSAYNYYSHARFAIHSVKLVQRSILNLLPRTMQLFLAHHFATVHSIEFTLEARK